MLKHRRANSDLYGIKTSKTISNESSMKIQNSSFNMNMMAEKQKSFNSKKTNTTENSNKRQDVNQLISNTYRLAKHFYQHTDQDYLQKLRSFLHGDWQVHKKNFILHLNKLQFMQDDMQKKNYHEIQLEIVQEWRRNQILYCIRAFWYQLISVKFFDSIDQFMGKYNLFREFIGQLAFLYFKNFFKTRTKTKNEMQQYLTKLVERTSHFIITHTTSWSKICDRNIMPLILNLVTIPGQQKQKLQKLTKIPTNQLDLQTFVIDNQCEQIQFPKTIDAIQKFILENKLLQKIKLLLDFRRNLEIQIRKRQSLLISQKKLKQYKILDKDDFIDCLVYCVIKGEIYLESLIASIKFIYNIFGCDTNLILSKFRCDAYLADLQAVAEYLLQKQIQI